MMCCSSSLHYGNVSQCTAQPHRPIATTKSPSIDRRSNPYSNLDLPFFKDPSKWPEGGSFDTASKASSLSPDFKLRIEESHNTFWDCDEVKGRELQPLKRSTKDGGEEEEDQENIDRDNEDGCGVDCDEQFNGDLFLGKNGISKPRALVALSKACGDGKDLLTGRRIHATAVRMGLLETNVFVGSTLVSMYAKCGALAEAEAVFDKLSCPNVVSWSALIAGYAQHGHCEQALICFELMQLERLSPNAVTFVSILTACGSIGAAGKGHAVHVEVVREGLLGINIVVGSALIDMYAKCGLLAKAQEVFDNLPTRNVVMWSTLIAAYSQQGQGDKALHYFEQMQGQGFFPNAVTFVSALKACGNTGAANIGQEIHAEITRYGMVEKDVFVGTALVDMYAKCGLLSEAQAVFENLPVRNLVSWNVLVAGYAQHGHSEQVLECSRLMELEGFSPDLVTYVCILKACASLRATDKGQEVHAEILREGLLEKDIVVSSALVDMYAKCGLLEKAQEVFDKLPTRDIVLWSALIGGYAQYGYGKEALNCFERMRLEGFAPDAITFVCILKACGNLTATGKGQEIHAEIAREGLLERDVFVGTALVDMYVKCGLLAQAQQVFDKLPVRTLVLWSALIAGYVQHWHGKEALQCFEKMLSEGFCPDAFLFVCILKICGAEGAADKGREIHTEIVNDGALGQDIFVATALVDMYAKCGLVAKAQEVFDNILVRDVVLWNALITGYSLHGKAENVFFLFNKMIEGAIQPDLITFITLLNACSHRGLVNKGQMYFEIMDSSYGITPTFEHYLCMVDLFGRAGHLDKAITVIKEMPFSADLMVWHVLLGACQKWQNVALGKLAFQHAVHLNEEDAGAFICMSNIYADGVEKLEDVSIESISQPICLT